MECPLCMEPLDLDDRSFYPCSCGYQICRFCWHRLRSTSHTSDFDSNSCPACRKPYQDQPANFKPVTLQELKSKKVEKKKKSISKKELAELRVLQKNLIFVVGLSQKISDVELLKRNEYFGRFGRILKVVVNGVKEGEKQQGSTAYITYAHPSEAYRAVTTVNNTNFDGRTIKVNLGTTKYCSHFLKSQACPKAECMYLHAVGDEEASFTKEDMLRGRHSELERRLVEEWVRGEKVQPHTGGQAAGGGGQTAAPPVAVAVAERGEIQRKKRGGGEKKGASGGGGRQSLQKPPPSSSLPWQVATTSSSSQQNANSGGAPSSSSSSSSLAVREQPAATTTTTTAKRSPPPREEPSSSLPWPQQQQQLPISRDPPPGLHNGYQNHNREPFLHGQPPAEESGLPNGLQEEEDDDLGFDPFAETQKQFEELIREESRRTAGLQWGRTPFGGGNAVGGSSPFGGPGLSSSGVVGAATTLPGQHQQQQPFTLLQQLPPPGYPPDLTNNTPNQGWLDDPAIIYSSLGQRRPPPGFNFNF